MLKYILKCFNDKSILMTSNLSESEILTKAMPKVNRNELDNSHTPNLLQHKRFFKRTVPIICCSFSTERFFFTQ